MRVRHSTEARWIAVACVTLGLGGWFAACSAGSDADGVLNGTGLSGTGGGTGGGTTGQGGFGQGGFNGGGNGQGGMEECGREPHEANLTPVDVVIMLDQSGSMVSPVGNTTIWQLVTGAITDFVNAPSSADLGVGLQYFPLPDGACDACATCFSPNLQLTDTSTNQCCCSYTTGQACALADGAPCPSGGVCFQGSCYSGGANATCTASDYGDLEVAIDLVSANQGAIIASLGNHGPRGLTPTAPALTGAIEAASAYATAHADHVVAVVLATDGVPTECSPTLVADIAAVAATAAAATPPVLTFVIGIGNVSALNAIASAGGTNQAYLVTPGANAGQAFLDALDAIHGSLLACEFDIPVPSVGPFDPALVNVEFTVGGQTQSFGQVTNAGACGPSGGWYYDDPNNPTKIVLCATSCDLVKSYTTGAALHIVLGCPTIIN